jgi:prephenate dehydratase
VVPVENSLAGSVPNAYELLLDSTLCVTGETLVAIDHVLVAPASTRREDVRRVLSHPVALAQCRDFFRRHPELEPVAVFDTAGAVAEVITHADGRSAAIASRRAAALHGAVIVEERIQDHAQNWTRFLRLSPTPAPPADVNVTCKALVAFELPHIPGALARALTTLGDSGVNLTRIESRAIHGRPFEYRFIVELTAPARRVLDGSLEALAAVALWQRCAGVFAAVT